VEEILLQHSGVQLAYCTAVPDAERDEIVAAVIVPKPGVVLTEDMLSAHCRQSLAAYKLPRRYRFATETELPRTTTGKLQKNKLASVFFGASQPLKRD
jgi:fatty-acyl-CoA synthase